MSSVKGSNSSAKKMSKGGVAVAGFAAIITITVINPVLGVMMLSAGVAAICIDAHVDKPFEAAASNNFKHHRM